MKNKSLPIAVACLIACQCFSAQIFTPIVFPDGNTFPPTNGVDYIWPLDGTDSDGWQFEGYEGDYTCNIGNTNWYWKHDLAQGIYVGGWYWGITNWNLDFYGQQQADADGNLWSTNYSVQWSSDLKVWYPEVYCVTGWYTVATDAQGNPVQDAGGNLIASNWMAIVFDSEGTPLVTNRGVMQGWQLPNAAITTNFCWPVMSGHGISSRFYRGVMQISYTNYGAAGLQAMFPAPDTHNEPAKLAAAPDETVSQATTGMRPKLVWLLPLVVVLVATAIIGYIAYRIVKCIWKHFEPAPENPDPKKKDPDSDDPD